MTSPRIKSFLIFLSLLCFFIILTAVYWPGLHGPFLLDDLQTISPAQMDHFNLKSFIEISMQNDTGPLGRPVSVASFALNYLFFGAEPFSFKAVNLGIHLLVGLCVGLFIYLITLLQPRVKPLALIIALLTMVFWLIHPIHVSTVLYPVQRMTQLAHLFILMGLNTYLVGRIRLNTQKPYAYLIMASSLFVFFPLAVFSKEIGVLYPWYLLCTEYFILHFHCKKIKDQNFLRRTHILLSLSLLLAACGYYWLQLSKFLAIFAEKNITLVDRLLTESKVLIFYLKLILFPQISKMGLYHDDFPISSGFDSHVITSALMLFCFAILIYSLRKRASILAFGLTWFFLSQVIESTVIPLELVFEHRNYLALLGIIYIPIYYLVTLLRHSSSALKGICTAFTLSLLVLLTTLTDQRSQVWSTPEKFLTEENYNHPQSARVHIEIANWYLTKSLYDNAFAQLNIAQDLQPYNAGIALHKMLILCRATSIPNEIYDEALNKIRQGSITPYVILVLDQMIQNMFEHSCSGVNKDKVRNIIEMAQKNPFLWYKPLYKAVLYHLESGLALLQNDVNQSRALLELSFQAYPKRLDPLIQKAYIEMQHGMTEQAEETIKLVHANARFLSSSSQNIATLDKALHAIKTKGSQ